MSDPTLSDNDFKNEMDWVWTTLKEDRVKISKNVVDTLTEEQHRRAFGNDVRQAPNNIIKSVLY